MRSSFRFPEINSKLDSCHLSFPSLCLFLKTIPLLELDTIHEDKALPLSILLLLDLAQAWREVIFPAGYTSVTLCTCQRDRQVSKVRLCDELRKSLCAKTRPTRKPISFFLSLSSGKPDGRTWKYAPKCGHCMEVPRSQ